MSTQRIEDWLPSVQAYGLNTDENVTFGTTATVTGGLRSVVTKSTNATLLQTEAGAVILLSIGSTATVTLPTPVVGLEYQFISNVTPVGGTLSIVTDAGTTFLGGALSMGETQGVIPFYALGNGTSHVRINLNGNTTGGLLGSRFTATCVSATRWQLSGLLAGSGSLATPFA